MGTVTCGTPSRWATALVSSCSAPNGQSQPQKTPRPQNSSPSAVKPQSRKITGSIRKVSQRKPESSDCRNATTCTTESCPPTIQPSQTSVTVRNA